MTELFPEELQYLHSRQLTHQLVWLKSVEGTEELKEHDSQGSFRLVSVYVGTVQQVDDGIIHSDLGLVSELEGILCRFDQGAEVVQYQSLEDPYAVRSECEVSPLTHEGNTFFSTGTRHSVFQSTGTFLILRLKLRGKAGAALGLLPPGPGRMESDGDGWSVGLSVRVGRKGGG